MTYEQAVEFWFGRVNFEQQTPRRSDLKLDRMVALLAALGNPQDELRIVHVAGSKGKGSTSATLASILRCAGFRTGLFTSPHLCRVEERIQIDSTPITGEELAALMAEVEPAVHLVDASQSSGAVSFFEVGTALGLLHFARRRVDAAIIEVGLGGRFDSTNVCDPVVAVITSISLDHTQQLGNTLARIAGEKAGILKSGRPAISGVQTPEARQVIEQVARDRGARLRQLGLDFTYDYEPGRVTSHSVQLPRVSIVSGGHRWQPMQIGLLGEHQAANAAVAVATVEELRQQGLDVPEAAVVSGLASVTWPARLEVVQRRPLVVLDCAHNLASADALVETLRSSFPPWQRDNAARPRRHLIFGGSNDKDLEGMFRVLTPHFSDLYLTRYGRSARSVAPAKLGDLVRRVSEVPFTFWPSAGEAYQAARAAAGPEDLICITGSVYLAGELLPLVSCSFTNRLADR